MVHWVWVVCGHYNDAWLSLAKLLKKDRKMRGSTREYSIWKKLRIPYVLQPERSICCVVTGSRGRWTFNDDTTTQHTVIFFTHRISYSSIFDREGDKYESWNCWVLFLFYFSAKKNSLHEARGKNATNTNDFVTGAIFLIKTDIYKHVLKFFY